jgi:hypothetical protein
MHALRTVALLLLIGGCATRPAASNFSGVTLEELNTYTQKVLARVREEGRAPDPSVQIRYIVESTDKRGLQILVPIVELRGKPNPFEWWRVNLQSGEVWRLPGIRAADQGAATSLPRMIRFG